MKQVTIQYFAVLREQRGVTEERVTTAAPNVRELYAGLELALDPKLVRCAVNGNIGDLDQGFEDGSVIVLIPPVAGG